MRLPDTTRLVRIALDGMLSAAEGALLVRGDTHPFALAGDWAGGGALVGSEPLAVAGPEDDPFDLLDRHVVAALNGDQITRHPELPLAGGDEIAFLAADAGG